jgi:hypothetical protein
MLKKSFAILALAAFCGSFTNMASAATYTFDGTFSDGLGGSFNFDTTISTVATADASVEQIINMTGTFHGSNIVSFAANPSFPGTSTMVNSDGAGANLEYDNKLMTSDKSLTGYGVVFTLANGQNIGLWGNSATSYGYFANWSNTGNDFNGSATIAAVPEPETYAMLLGGLGILGVVARRKKQAA